MILTCEEKMPPKALFPAGTRPGSDTIKLSPGLVSGGHVFLTGMTGSSPDGTMPERLEDQFRQAFEKIGAVLREAGLGFDPVGSDTAESRKPLQEFNTLSKSISYDARDKIEIGPSARPEKTLDIKASISLTNYSALAGIRPQS